MDPDEVAYLLHHAEVPWWIAGGWAIDLHLGRCTRAHEDIDVLVLRPHLPRLREQLAGWDLHAADPPGTLRPWPVREVLPLGVHDIWCRPTPSAPWCLQLMVDDLVEDGGSGGQGGEREWVYRRDARVRRPWRTLFGPASRSGRGVLAPEVQLLYKSTSSRERDEGDFAEVVAVLDTSQRRWLIEALQRGAVAHPWIEQLRGAVASP